jgi:hypothetical protein
MTNVGICSNVKIGDKSMNLDYQLKPEHREAGLHLEDDEDFIYLTINDEGIAIFRPRVTRSEILETADRYIRASKGSRLIWIMKNTCNA